MESVLREPVDRARVHIPEDQSGLVVVVEGRVADGWLGASWGIAGDSWGFWKCGVVISHANSYLTPVLLMAGLWPLSIT